MTTIKIESDSLKESVSKANTAVSNYQDKVISAATIFLDITSTLSGQGYDALLEQTNKSIESQKKIVTECKILSDEIKNYTIEMANAEASVSFPS